MNRSQRECNLYAGTGKCKKRIESGRCVFVNGGNGLEKRSSDADCSDAVAKHGNK